MLVGQDRGRNEHGHLLAVLHGLEGGPDGDFGLAEAHVAAHEPVHGHGLLHIALDGLGRGGLIGSVFVLEGRSISRCQTVSGEKAKPREALRFA